MHNLNFFFIFDFDHLINFRLRRISLWLKILGFRNFIKYILEYIINRLFALYLDNLIALILKKRKDRLSSSQVNFITNTDCFGRIESSGYELASIFWTLGYILKNWEIRNR